MTNKAKAVAVLGPTATGKTALGVTLSRALKGEIVSADSRQVYRGLDIGSGKDLGEYGEVRHHLLDVADPTEFYDLSRFQADATAALGDIAERGHVPLLVGGSALYLDCLLSGYALPGPAPDPELRAQVQDLTAAELAARLAETDPEALARVQEPGNRPRLVRALENAAASPRPPGRSGPNFEWLVLGVYYPRAEVHRRIEARLDARLANGLIEEVRGLHDAGLAWERLDAFGLEYRFVSQYLRGELDFTAMRDKLLAKIRRLARGQDIWFRKMEREGRDIHWIERGDPARALALATDFLAGRPLPRPVLRLADIHYGPKTS